MRIEVRAARQRDVPAMVRLIEQRRLDYERFEPVFWRRAPRAARRTALFYRLLLLRGSTTALVASEEGGVTGFLIARRTRVPPVYDPGGTTVVVDDFAVAGAARWATTGEALLARLRAVGRAAGWRQIVMVCGAADRAKSDLLPAADLHIAATWWTTTL